MNSFDIAVYLGLLIAVMVGFNTGLLRSAITILAYLFAMPIAVWAMSIVPQTDGKADSVFAQHWILFLIIFLLIGMVLGKFARMAVDDAIGSEPGFGDRLGGAALGAIRVVMVATTLVLVFDQLVPDDRQPGFLKGSQLRPLLSAVGQRGFRSLPPEATAAIDRLKRERRI